MKEKQKYGLIWMYVPEVFEEKVENKLSILKEILEFVINNNGKLTHILIIRDDFHALTYLNYTHKSKIAEVYKGPWEIAEICNNKKSTWIYAWNEKLKSLWVLEVMGEYPEELDKVRSITFLSGKNLNYKNYIHTEDINYRQ